MVTTTNELVNELSNERDLVGEFIALHQGNKSVERIYGQRFRLLDRSVKEAQLGYTKDALWQRIRSGSGSMSETTERVLKFLFIKAFAPKVQVDL